MKKIIYALVFFIAFISFLFHIGRIEEPRVDVIPSCHVQEKSYFTNYRDYVEEMDEGYTYYGTINSLEVYDYEKPRNDLSTNADNYMGKEIYVNPKDDSLIYIKYEDNKYQILYYDQNSYLEKMETNTKDN